jgi:hypothetical protein
MVGLATNLSSMRATRTAPMGPFHGMSEMARAAEAPAVRLGEGGELGALLVAAALEAAAVEAAATVAAHQAEVDGVVGHLVAGRSLRHGRVGESGEGGAWDEWQKSR